MKGAGVTCTKPRLHRAHSLLQDLYTSSRSPVYPDQGSPQLKVVIGLPTTDHGPLVVQTLSTATASH